MQLDLCTVKFTIKPACQNKHAFFGDVTDSGLTLFWMLTLTGDNNGWPKWRNCKLSPYYQLGWAFWAASRLLDTLKCSFCFMYWKVSRPTLLHNIKGTYHRGPLYSSSTLFFLGYPWRLKSKVCMSLVWYSIDREDQENESIFCTKGESLDWTEITKSGTRQN